MGSIQEENGAASFVGGGLPTYFGNINTTINRERVGICQSCGFDYLYLTSGDVYVLQNAAKKRVLICTVIFAGFVVFAIWFTGGFSGAAT